MPVTYDPYEYAGQMPTDVTDASGQGWVFPWDVNNPIGEFHAESIVGGRAVGDPNPGLGISDQGLLARDFPAQTSAETGYWVPVLKHGRTSTCLAASAGDLSHSWLKSTTYNANVVDRVHHVYWDIEQADAYAHNTGGITSRLKVVLHDGKTDGFLWPTSTCNQFILWSCAGQELTPPDPSLQLGTDFPTTGLPADAQRLTYHGVAMVELPSDEPGWDIVVGQPKAASGLLVYRLVKVPVTPICPSLLQCMVAAGAIAGTTAVLVAFPEALPYAAVYGSTWLAGVGVTAETATVASMGLAAASTVAGLASLIDPDAGSAADLAGLSNALAIGSSVGEAGPELQSAEPPEQAEEEVPPFLLGRGPSQQEINKNAGDAFEKAVEASLRRVLNNNKVQGPTRSGAIVTTEPDFLDGTIGVTDVKNAQDLSNVRQLQAQAGYARLSNQPFSLIIGPDTQTVSVPLQEAVRRAGGIIVRFDPASGRFSGVVFDKAPHASHILPWR